MKLLDDLPTLDWTRPDVVHESALATLRGMASDPRALGDLLRRVEHTPSLWALCETHELDDKIVLYDAMKDRGFRIRFRLATAYQDERPHTHRFTFSTLILRGSYHQTWYRGEARLEDGASPHCIVPVAVREEPAGSGFTIDHAALHSTMAAPDTISLVMRGPAMKRRAIITLPEVGEVTWRYGEADETAERRADIRMPIERYREWCQRLADFGIVR